MRLCTLQVKQIVLLKKSYEKDVLFHNIIKSTHFYEVRSMICSQSINLKSFNIRLPVTDQTSAIFWVTLLVEVKFRYRQTDRQIL